MRPSFSSLDLFVHGDKVRDVEAAIGFGKEEPVGVSWPGKTTPLLQEPGGYIGCRVLHSHEIGRSEIERSQVDQIRRGQMQILNSFSFC